MTTVRRELLFLWSGPSEFICYWLICVWCCHSAPHPSPAHTLTSIIPEKTRAGRDWWTRCLHERGHRELSILSLQKLGTGPAHSHSFCTSAFPGARHLDSRESGYTSTRRPITMRKKSSEGLLVECTWLLRLDLGEQCLRQLIPVCALSAALWDCQKAPLEQLGGCEKVHQGSWRV